MELPTPHLLATVEAPLLSADARCFGRLRVNDASTRLGVSTEPHTQAFTYRAVESLPGTIQAPGPEVVKDRLPRRELSGQHAPMAAALQDVEDSIQDLAGAVQPRTSTPSRSWKVGLKQSPSVV